MVYESREEDVEAYVGYDFRLTPVQDMQWMIDPSDQAAITIFLTLCTPCKCNVPYGSFSSKISNSRDSVHANLQSGGSWLIKTNLVSSLWYRNALGSYFNKGKDLFLNFMRKGIWVRALIENWNPRFDNRIVNLNWLESADRN
jgi:hypothetical protein